MKAVEPVGARKLAGGAVPNVAELALSVALAKGAGKRVGIVVGAVPNVPVATLTEEFAAGVVVDLEPGAPLEKAGSVVAGLAVGFGAPRPPRGTVRFPGATAGVGKPKPREIAFGETFADDTKGGTVPKLATGRLSVALAGKGADGREPDPDAVELVVALTRKGAEGAVPNKDGEDSDVALAETGDGRTPVALAVMLDDESNADVPVPNPVAGALRVLLAGKGADGTSVEAVCAVTMPVPVLSWPSRLVSGPRMLLGRFVGKRGPPDADVELEVTGSRISVMHITVSRTDASVKLAPGGPEPDVGTTCEACCAAVPLGSENRPT